MYLPLARDRLASTWPPGLPPPGLPPPGLPPPGLPPPGLPPPGLPPPGLPPPVPLSQRQGEEGVLADGGVLPGGRVLPGRAVLAGGRVLPREPVLPGGVLSVLPALRGLLPAGGLQRGSVVAAGRWSLLCLALAAGASAAGAWCAAAGLPQLGVAAAADAGLDPGRLLLIAEPGPSWPQVVAALLDGCEIVLVCPPDRPSAQVRRKLEAAIRRYGGVLVVAGDWEGAQTRLRVARQEWTGTGTGHGRLRARRVQVLTDGRGAWSRPRTQWLWLPAPDGSVAIAAAGIADGVAGAGAAMGEVAESAGGSDWAPDTGGDWAPDTGGDWAPDTGEASVSWRGANTG